MRLFNGFKHIISNHKDKCDTNLRINSNLNVKLLVIADTHGCLDDAMMQKYELDDVQACVLLGDHSVRDIQIIKEYIGHLPLYGVLGNHDGFDLHELCGVENIHGRSVEVNGVRLIGLNGSIKYKDSVMPLYTDEESVEIVNKFDDADILISHDSPKYFHSSGDDFAHSGLRGVTEYCAKHDSLNIHGHHHWPKIGVTEDGVSAICCYEVQVVEIVDGIITVKE